MTSQRPDDERALLEAVRRTWEIGDPVPEGLADRMIAAVASAGLSEEYALLTLVESDTSAVRADTDQLILRFTHGSTTLLIQVGESVSGGRRIDGWIAGVATEVHLIQDSREWRAEVDDGRFAFDDVPAGIVRLRVTLEPGASGGETSVITSGFEV
ncbi:hypothetical protein [Cumulibacter manganitolerans]|uniref:hypothetical protein n=1 Tax=Cumulibacter manganitolerans TaxID=1884992 RepID=UPI001E3B2F62|nr:hypothetical protein [Cumulibacter manganitolerans]